MFCNKIKRIKIGDTAILKLKDITPVRLYVLNEINDICLLSFILIIATQSQSQTTDLLIPNGVQSVMWPQLHHEMVTGQLTKFTKIIYPLHSHDHTWPPQRWKRFGVCVEGGGGDHQYWEDRKSSPHCPGVWTVTVLNHSQNQCHWAYSALCLCMGVHSSFKMTVQESVTCVFQPKVLQNQDFHVCVANEIPRLVSNPIAY